MTCPRNHLKQLTFQNLANLTITSHHPTVCVIHDIECNFFVAYKEALRFHAGFKWSQHWALKKPIKFLVFENCYQFYRWSSQKKQKISQLSIWPYLKLNSWMCESAVEEVWRQKANEAPPWGNRITLWKRIIQYNRPKKSKRQGIFKPTWSLV